MTKEDVCHSEEKTSTKEKRPYNLYISDNMYEKIGKIISILKYVNNKPYTRQDFVMEAIREKMENDAKNPLSICRPSKAVYIKIDADIESEISKQVSLIKKYSNNSYSKKRWIEEALLKKIDIEEKKAIELLEQAKISDEN